MSGNRLGWLRDINHFGNLDFYQLAFRTAMKIYEINVSFPSENRNFIVDQIKHTSQSIGANITQGWCKRAYKIVFKK